MAEGVVSGSTGAVQYGEAGFTRSGAGGTGDITEAQVDAKIAAIDLYTPVEAAADMDAKIAAAKPDRLSFSFTTATLAPGAGADHNALLAGAFLAHSLTLSQPARLRLYRTAAVRTADAAREPGAEIPDSVIQDILMDVVLPFEGLLSINLEATICALLNDGGTYWRLTNMTSSTVAVTATLSYLILEGL
jgi:hypothetical protein